MLVNRKYYIHYEHFESLRLSLMVLGKNAKIGIVAVVLVATLVVAGGAFVLSSPNSTDDSADKLQVVASFYPLYYFSSEIGKDKVAASMLIPDNAEPHSWEPSPSDLKTVDNADVLVYNGQGFEPWMDTFLASTTNNKMIVVDTSKNVSLMLSSEVKEVYDMAEDILSTGPNSSIAASSSEGSAPVVEANPMKLDVKFADISGSRGGFISLTVSEGGDYRFFVTNDTSFKILFQNGTEIPYEMNLDQVSWYPQFHGTKFFELEAGENYYVSFGPSDVEGTDLVMVRAESEEGGEEDEHQHEGEHQHGLNDPHFWLDPINAKIQVENILASYKQADPDNAAFFQKNADDLHSRLDSLNQEFVDGLANRTKNAIVTTHEGFDYIAARYGIQAYAAIGISADSQPSAQDLANLAQQVNDLGLHYVYGEPIYSDAIIDTIASETGAQVLVLDGIHGRSGVHAGMDYFQIMEENLKNLQEGLEVTS
jgi:ABC-type Zn uptake system ZnuABC Zn-binding protein ZnuA